MSETHHRVKQSLTALLRDPDQKVIALTGKWGTGKTYLWNSVKSGLLMNEVLTSEPIYVSLFGARNINDLKLRILQSACSPNSEGGRKTLATIGSILSQWGSRLVGFSPQDIALQWISEFVKGKLIVIDDVERKHKDLGVGELLGIINEYSETRGARFLVLLNTGELKDSTELWATLHEKVFDSEIILQPTGSESFEIAAEGRTGPHLPDVRQALAILNISNIRVIRRILKVAERIASIKSVSDAPTSRWIPSTVLMSASSYRAVENAPPFEYIKSYNSFARAFEKKDQPPDPEELGWDSMLDKLGIRFADEFEDVLDSFLRSGLLDELRIEALFSGYKNEAEIEAARQKRRIFFTAVFWDHKKSNSELIAMVRDLLSSVNLLGPDEVTDLISVARDLGDAGLAQQFLDSWSQSLPTRAAYQDVDEGSFDHPHRPYDPDVDRILKSLKRSQHPSLSVVEVAERVVKNSGWGDREKAALKNSTIDQYENALNELRNDDLRHFVRTHIDWIRNGAYDDNFKTGIHNFVAAAKRIYDASPESRLSGILLNAFKSQGLAAKLQPCPKKALPAK